MSRSPLRRRKKKISRSHSRPKLLIVGLGNPGRKYARTLHNAGHMAIELLARTMGVKLAVAGDLDRGIGGDEATPVLLARPRTYMNLSGLAVAPVYRAYAESPGDLIVLHDDLDIPPGQVRL